MGAASCLTCEPGYFVTTNFPQTSDVCTGLSFFLPPLRPSPFALHPSSPITFTALHPFLTFLACTSILDCDSVSCAAAGVSQCGLARAGFFIQSRYPATSDELIRMFRYFLVIWNLPYIACTPIANCSSSLTCTSSTDSKCTSCFPPLIPDDTQGSQTVCILVFIYFLFPRIF